MVQVCMGQDHRVDRDWVDRQRLPITLPQLLQPLKEAAVDQNPAVINLQQVFRSGHGARRTKEGQEE